MDNPLIIIHGWSDTSESFHQLAQWLRGHDLHVTEIFLGDYLSTYDDLTLFDLGLALQRALKDKGISQDRHSFDVVVHSTGGLVIREYLRQVCQGDSSKTPVRRLLMMAPANFGSPLAKMGKSVLGRMFKGMNWDHTFQTGEKILDALEVASSYSWELAEWDLFRSDANLFHEGNVSTTLMVGTRAYGSKTRAALHKNGSDGTVFVSTANLNTLRLTLDMSNPKIEEPELKVIQQQCPKIATAVLDRDHSTIYAQGGESDEDKVWRDVVLGALTVVPGDYDRHAKFCDSVSQSTFIAGAKTKHPEWYVQFQHLVFRVRDQFGNPVSDYVVLFYVEGDKEEDAVALFQRDLMQVKANSKDPSYRSFLLNTEKLKDFLEEHPNVEVRLKVIARNTSEVAGYVEPSRGPVIFSKSVHTYIRPNETVLVDVILHRRTEQRVFRLEPLAG